MRCLFEETQRFTQWWVWVILLFSLAPLFYVETNSLYIKLIGVSLLVFIFGLGRLIFSKKIMNIFQ